ncbi:hypothetical protein BDF22DRAFT_664745 [Syncephalis plumigaleata]|nr:hypothetical protein BDF22DRAFT_664745 [Syncephalis plumigaleata]
MSTERNNLPYELLMLVFQRLDTVSLFALARVNRKLFCAIAANHDLWKHIYKQKYLVNHTEQAYYTVAKYLIDQSATICHASVYMLLCMKRANAKSNRYSQGVLTNIACYLESHAICNSIKVLTEFAGQMVVLDSSKQLLFIDGRVQPIDVRKLAVVSNSDSVMDMRHDGKLIRAEQVHLTSSLIIGKLFMDDGVEMHVKLCAWRKHDGSLVCMVNNLDRSFRLVDILDDWLLLGESSRCGAHIIYKVCSLESGNVCNVFQLDRSAACHLQKAKQHHVYLHCTLPIDEGRYAQWQLWKICANGLKRCVVQGTTTLPSTGGYNLILTRRINEHAVISQFWINAAVEKACHLTFHTLAKRGISWGRALAGDSALAVIHESGALFTSGFGRSCSVINMADGATLRCLRFPTKCYMKLDLGFVARVYGHDDDRYIRTTDLRYMM